MSETLTIQVLFDPAMLADPSQEAAIRQKLADFTEVEESTLGPLLEEEQAENFATRGFGTWAPLSPFTVAEKQRLGYGGRPDLVRTGALQAAFIPGMPGHIFSVTPNGVTVGVSGEDIPYANALAEGDPSHNLPARMLITIRNQTVQELIDILAEWIGGGQAVQIVAAAPTHS